MARALFQALLAVLLLGALLACGGDDGPSLSADAGTAPVDAGTAPVDGGRTFPTSIGPDDRRARVVIPTAHDGTTALPLVVLLHGYSASAIVQDAYFGATGHARSHGYYLLLPDGTVDSAGNRFWNATPACCDRDGTGVDDEGYLRGLVGEMKETFPVDDGRVYFIGHSNGGFMSYRMACAMADQVTAIMSLAGSSYSSETACGATEPVSVLQVHGTLDTVVPYAGGAFYPGAEAVAERWAARAGCDTTTTTEGEAMDLETNLAGAETTVKRWRAGCADGVDAELWSIVGGSHVPVFTDGWMPAVTEWLFRHAK